MSKGRIRPGRTGRATRSCSGTVPHDCGRRCAANPTLATAEVRESARRGPARRGNGRRQAPAKADMRVCRSAAGRAGVSPDQAAGKGFTDMVAAVLAFLLDAGPERSTVRHGRGATGPDTDTPSNTVGSRSVAVRRTTLPAAVRPGVLPGPIRPRGRLRLVRKVRTAGASPPLHEPFRRRPALNPYPKPEVHERFCSTLLQQDFKRIPYPSGLACRARDVLQAAHFPRFPGVCGSRVRRRRCCASRVRRAGIAYGEAGSAPRRCEFVEGPCTSA